VLRDGGPRISELTAVAMSTEFGALYYGPCYIHGTAGRPADR